MEIHDSTQYSTEIYTYGSKIRGKFGAGAAMYDVCGPSAEKAVQI